MANIADNIADPANQQATPQQVASLTAEQTSDQHITQLAQTDPVVAELASRFEQLKVDLVSAQNTAAAAQAEASRLKELEDGGPVSTAEAIKVVFEDLYQDKNQRNSSASEFTHQKELRLATPPKFDGKRPQELRTFIGTLGLHFVSKPDVYDTDARKIAFATSFIEGTPLQLVLNELAVIVNKRAPWMLTWSEFTAHLLTNFGVLDEMKAAISKLRTLRQTSSASKYFIEFYSIAHLTGWDDKALMDEFRLGLKPSVKDAMVLHPEPRTLYECKELAIKLDNRIYERELEEKNNVGKTGITEDRGSGSRDRKDFGRNGGNDRNDRDNFRVNNNRDSGGYRNGYGNGRSGNGSGEYFGKDKYQDGNRSGNRGFQASGYNNNKSNEQSSQVVKYVPPPTDPSRPSMEVDALVKYGPLSQEQKDYRRRNGLCIYCGLKHAWETCHKRRNRNQAYNNNNRTISSATATFSITKPQGSESKN